MKREKVTVEEALAEIGPEVSLILDDQVELFARAWQKALDGIEERVGSMNDEEYDLAFKLVEGLLMGLSAANVRAGFAEAEEGPEDEG